MTEYRGATKVPAKMYDKLIRLAQTYPSPKQFYEHAVELGKQYGIHENDLVRWGLIDAHHKPHPKLGDGTMLVWKGPSDTTTNHTEPREQQPPPITEEDIVRGHRATKKEKKP